MRYMNTFEHSDGPFLAAFLFNGFEYNEMRIWNSESTDVSVKLSLND
jgi:hypothetical protein